MAFLLVSALVTFRPESAQTVQSKILSARFKRIKIVFTIGSMIWGLRDKNMQKILHFVILIKMTFFRLSLKIWSLTEKNLAKGSVYSLGDSNVVIDDFLVFP